MSCDECKRTVHSIPPPEIFDFFHEAEAAGLSLPVELDEWWEEETWGPKALQEQLADLDKKISALLQLKADLQKMDGGRRNA